MVMNSTINFKSRISSSLFFVVSPLGRLVNLKKDYVFDSERELNE